MAFPGLTFLVLYAWPLIERLGTGDREAHHVAESPCDHPARTAFGAAALTFYGLLLLAGGDDVLADLFGVPIGTVVAVLRVAVLAMPFVVGAVVYVLARALRDSRAPGVLSLQRPDGTTAMRRRPQAELERQTDRSAG